MTTGKRAPIKKIVVDPHGHLQVCPDVSVCGGFKYIWRDASGVRWDNATEALMAYEPDRWQADKLFQQILCAVASEYGWKLEITQDTVWVDVPDDVKKSILNPPPSFLAIFEK